KLHLLEPNYNVVIDGVNTAIESKFFSAFPGDYELSPVSFRALGREVFYDNKHKCFMYIADYNKPNLLVSAAKPTGPFDPADVGLTLVWGKFTKSPRNVYECNSLFKDDDEKRYYLKFNMNNKAAVEPLKKVEIPANFALNNATIFTGNILEDFIYFA